MSKETLNQINLNALKEWMKEVSDFIDTYRFEVEKKNTVQHDCAPLSLLVDDVFKWVI